LAIKHGKQPYTHTRRKPGETQKKEGPFGRTGRGKAMKIPTYRNKFRGKNNASDAKMRVKWPTHTHAEEWESHYSETSRKHNTHRDTSDLRDGAINRA